MMKSLFLLPLFLNFMMILIISMPSKYFKFHPMSLFILMFFLNMFMISNMNLLYKSWLFYFIFLIIIGGLMIMFMYICSISSNNSFEFPINNLFNILIKLILIIFIFKIYSNFYFNIQDEWNLNLNSYESFNSKIIFNIFKTNWKSIFFFFTYLFFSLIMIIHICYKLMLPLRQIKNYV